MTETLRSETSRSHKVSEENGEDALERLFFLSSSLRRCGRGMNLPLLLCIGRSVELLVYIVRKLFDGLRG
jgi:hypothetical protein